MHYGLWWKIATFNNTIILIMQLWNKLYLNFLDIFNHVMKLLRTQYYWWNHYTIYKALSLKLNTFCTNQKHCFNAVLLHWIYFKDIKQIHKYFFKYTKFTCKRDKWLEFVVCFKLHNIAHCIDMNSILWYAFLTTTIGKIWMHLI